MRKLTLVLLLPFGIVLAQPPADTLQEAEEALKDRQYARAADLFRKAHDRAKAGQDRILYLLATACEHAGKYEEGIEACDRLNRAHPASPWAFKASFKKGDLLAKKKEEELAAKIYAAQVEALASPKRRKPLAMIYVKAGGDFLRPKEKGDPSFRANYPAAHRLLAKALDLEALGADEAAVRFDLITCEEKGGFDRRQLLASADLFLKKFPKDTHLAEVRLTRGRALAQLGRRWEAKKAWREIVLHHPKSESAPQALWEIATQDAGLPGLSPLREIVAKYPKSKLAPQAAMAVADRLSAHEDLRVDAMAAYLDVARRFPKDERAPNAVIRWCELKVAEERLDDAVAMYESFLKTYPENPRWGEVRGRIAELRYQKAYRALLREEHAAARRLFEEFLKTYPVDSRAPRIGLFFASMLRKEKKPDAALAQYRRVAERYPRHGEAREARRAAGDILVEKEDFESAIKEYEKAGAHDRIGLLRSESVRLQSERVFPTTDRAVVKLTLRNFKEASFRLWALDLKDYFEKRASTSGLHQVEVGVIAPDKEWKYVVPQYKKYKEFKVDVPVPAAASGAYIVTARAGRQEATTVVLVSDLAFLAKAGRRQVVLLGQDMRRGISLDTIPFRVAADGKLLKDGSRFPDELDPRRLSILAEVLGNFAFKDLEVSSLARPMRRRPVALLLPDRSVYGTDDTVRIRILIRDVEANTWIAPKDKKYVLTAVASNGLELLKRPLRLTRSGTAEATLKLFTGLTGVRFDVHESAHPLPILLGRAHVAVGPSRPASSRFQFLLEERDYFLGDPVELTILLRDRLGRPIGHRLFHYHVAGDAEWKEAMTDAYGAFPLRITETERFSASGCFVETRFGSIHGSYPIPLFPRGYWIEIDPATRPLEPVLAGEPKTIVFRTRDFARNAVQRKVRWVVARQDKAGVWVLVAHGETSSDKEGKGSFSFPSKLGGLHTILVRGRDARGYPVRATTAVSVSDEKDPVKLRILSERDEFEPGKPVRLSVHSRVERGMGFVVVENEKIELSKKIAIEKGWNRLSLDLGGKRLRNFRVTVALLQGNKFYSAVRDFRMAPAPAITVVPDKKEPRPGETVTFTVNAGRPSEVWFVLAEAIHTSLSPDAIQPALPGPFYVTHASNTSSFAGVTSQIDPALQEALARLQNLQQDGIRVMLRTPDAEDEKAANKYDKDRPLRGRYLGQDHRFGGRGGEFARKRPFVSYAQERPLLFVSAATDAKGEARFKVRLPLRAARLRYHAYAVDATNAISSLSGEIRSRADIDVELACPPVLREGDRAQVSVFVLNRSGKPKKTELGTMPARSLREFLLPAREDFSVTVDGRTYHRRIRMLSAQPERVALAGGTSFAVGPEGSDPVELDVRVASSTRERLLRLAEGADSPFLGEADLAARLIALSLARHPDAANVALRLRSTPASADVPSAILRYIAIALHDPKHKPSPAPLHSSFSGTPYDEQKALILFALSRGGEANAAYVRRLYRTAERLSPRGRSVVALLLHAAGRVEEAKRLFGSIRGDDPAALPYGDWTNTAITSRAFRALAARTLGSVPDVPIEVVVPRTPFERAVLALATALSKHEEAKVILKVNGKATRPGRIDRALLVRGPQRIEVSGGDAWAVFRYRGTARPSDLEVRAERKNAWPALVVAGHALRTDLVVVDGESPKGPSLKRTAAGTGFSSTIQYTFSKGGRGRYVLVEPLPAGLDVVSVQAWGFLSYEIRPGAIRLLLERGVGEQKAGLRVSFLAAHPGMCAPGPLALRRLEEIDLAHAAAAESFEVLAAGADYRKGVNPTPEERYQIGALRHAKKEWKEAKENLEPLFEKILLREPYYTQAARMLAYASIELKDHAATVRFFEILKEKLPSEVVPFDKILAVGRAYASLKEFDRARQVFSGTADAYFLQEANLVAELERLGRTREEADVMRRFLREFPDTSLNREMSLGFGQDLLNRGKAMKEAEKDPHRLSRRETLDRAAEILDEFLLLHPSEKKCDRASLAQGSAYLEARRYPQAEKAGRAASRRYPKSRYLDAFDYIQAYALFAQKKFGDALAMCKRIETFDYGKQANPGPLVMRNLAVLMTAQIHHAKGELDQALAAYKKVRAQFADAARALAFLEREAISIPEVTVVPTPKPNKIEVEYSGVSEVHVKVYKVNLTMLFLKYRGVKDASAIEVAGIRPVFEKTYPLDRPGSKRRERQDLSLEIPATGAYLVSIKAGGFFASSLFLKSDLAMTVQEEAASGTARVNVTSAQGGKFQEDVKVTFIGSADRGFQSAKTDLRGIAEASGLRGYAMVIAEKDAHFAFFRGTTPLSGYLPQQRSAESRQQKEMDALKDKLKELKKTQLFYRQNRALKQSGVEIERTKK